MCFAIETLKFNKLHSPVDLFGNNVTISGEGVVDAVMAGGVIVREHRDVEPGFIGERMKT